MNKLEQFAKLSTSTGLVYNLPIDLGETKHRFYVCEKKVIKDITIPIFVLFVKTDDVNVLENYSFLHAQLINYPKCELRELENKYFDECTHFLWFEYGNEEEDIDKETRALLQNFATSQKLKQYFNWVYPIQFENF